MASTIRRAPCDSKAKSPLATESAYSKTYAKPEQPDGLTARRTPAAPPRSRQQRKTCAAAFSVRVIAIARKKTNRAVRRLLSVAFFLFVIGDRRLDGILGENGAVDFYRRQFQLFGDMGVFDFQRLINGFAAHPLGDER